MPCRPCGTRGRAGGTGRGQGSAVPAHCASMAGHRLVLLLHLQPECLLVLELEAFPALGRLCEKGRAQSLWGCAEGNATFVLLATLWNVLQASWITYFPAQRTLWLQPPLLPTALDEDLFVSCFLNLCPTSDH